MSESILDLLTEGEAYRFQRLAAVSEMTREQRSTMLFYRSGGKENQRRKQRMEKENEDARNK
jgi:hypothetical protein